MQRTDLPTSPCRPQLRHHLPSGCVYTSPSSPAVLPLPLLTLPPRMRRRYGHHSWVLLDGNSRPRTQMGDGWYVPSLPFLFFSFPRISLPPSRCTVPAPMLTRPPTPTVSALIMGTSLFLFAVTDSYVFSSSFSLTSADSCLHSLWAYVGFDLLRYWAQSLYAALLYGCVSFSSFFRFFPDATHRQHHPRVLRLARTR